MAGGFTFKRFAIEQQRSAMKVGTDGVLLGAWANINPSQKRFLDIGAGTGLIALMVAQRSEEWSGSVVGVEIDPQSFMDARENVASCPWRERVVIENCAIQEFAPDVTFDHILSNPPYFVDSLLSPNEARTNARHTTTLTFEALAHSASRLLSAEGVVSLILPYDAVADMTLAAVRAGLFLVRRMDVRSKPSGAPMRSLLEYSPRPAALQREELTIHSVGGDFSPEYRALTRDFYLKF